MSKAITSPRGLAVYPHLNRPDTKFDPDGHYKTGLKLDPSDEKVSEFLEGIRDQENRAALQHAMETTGKKKAQLRQAASVIKEEEDDDGKPTGFVILNFKTKAKGKSKSGEEWTRKLAIVDHKLQPLDANVGGGSTIRVAFNIKPYFMPTTGYGVSLYLNMVQVIDLVTFGAGAEELFEEEEPSVDELELDPSNF